MIYPLKKWEITSKYGQRLHPVTKEKTFHNGIDLKANTGTEIYAPFDGKVIMIDDFDDDASTRKGRMDRKSRLLDLFDF
jgi:murein DD-endopeptidase MepM/ murein hydrolase activator NlpD